MNLRPNPSRGDLRKTMHPNDVPRVSPSPRPSPSGRGRTFALWFVIRTAQTFATRLRREGSSSFQGRNNRCSLSPGERARACQVVARSAPGPRPGFVPKRQELRRGSLRSALRSERRLVRGLLGSWAQSGPAADEAASHEPRPQSVDGTTMRGASPPGITLAMRPAWFMGAERVCGGGGSFP